MSDPVVSSYIGLAGIIISILISIITLFAGDKIKDFYGKKSILNANKRIGQLQKGISFYRDLSLNSISLVKWSIQNVFIILCWFFIAICFEKVLRSFFVINTVELEQFVNFLVFIIYYILLGLTLTKLKVIKTVINYERFVLVTEAKIEKLNKVIEIKNKSVKT